MSSEQVFIIAGKRSAVAPHSGAFASLTYYNLAAQVVIDVLKDAKMDKHEVDEIIVSNALGAGGNPARMVSLEAKLNLSVGGISIDRQCCGGLDAISIGTDLIKSGRADVVVAGGVESYSTRPVRLHPENSEQPLVPYDRPAFAPFGFNDPNLAEATAMLARKFGISKKEQDEWSINSHLKALKSTKILKSEITPILNQTIDLFTRELNQKICERAPKLSDTITHANSAIAADAAGFVVLVSEHYLKNKMCKGVEVLGTATSGVLPEEAPLAPVVAIKELLDQKEMNLSEVAFIELMEAYAAQAILCTRLCDLDLDKVNIRGGALSRGHPIGASGAILAVRLFNELIKIPGTYGMAAIAAAGGIGSAMALKS
jgi:acetyl-CoA C-acetyltransferase